MFELGEIIQKIAIIAVPLLLAVILHEVAHGWVAEKLGDPTARLMGRITLNPIPHIDVWWTILLPLTLILSGSRFIFGGAKPVRVNPLNFRNPRRDMMWVALSGPATNVILAIVVAIVFHVLRHVAEDVQSRFFITLLMPILYMLHVAIVINVVLAVFNMIPVPPLDGSKVIMGILPYELSATIARIAPYGIFILLILIFTGILHRIINPLIGVMLHVLL